LLADDAQTLMSGACSMMPDYCNSPRRITLIPTTPSAAAEVNMLLINVNRWQHCLI